MSKGWDALMSGCVKQKETVVNGRAGDVQTLVVCMEVVSIQYEALLFTLKEKI